MENICRTCLRVPSNLTPLYTDSTLITKIETIASIQVNTNENYPSNICEECISNVNILYNFRKVIRSSDKELKEQIATLQRVRKPPEVQAEEINVKNEEYDTVFETVDTTPDPGELSNSESETENLRKRVKKAIRKMNACECNLCGKVFASRFKLHSHKRNQHVTPGVCSVCGMVVRSDNLNRHIQMHLAAPVECKECGKIFKNPESLRGHMLIHRGTIFTCEICGKVSKVKAEHKRHMRTHEDPSIGKLMCVLCGKRVRDMKKHMNSHTGERPYTCTFCKRGFCSPYSLKVHTRQHTNERPYPCSHCNMRFPQKVSLVTHLKSKHGKT